MNVLSKLCPVLFFGYQKRRETQTVSGGNKEKEETIERKREKKEAVTKEVVSFELRSDTAVLPMG